MLLTKLRIAVIYHHEGVLALFFNQLYRFRNHLISQGAAGAVAGALLQIYHFYVALFQAVGNGIPIKAGISSQFDLFIADPEILQASAALFSRKAYDALKGIVRGARDCQHRIARAKQAEKGQSQSVGAGKDTVPYEGAFRFKYTGVYAIQYLSAHIVVAVTGGGVKAFGGNSLFAKGFQYFFLIEKGKAVDFAVSLSQIRFRLFCQRKQLIIKLQHFFPLHHRINLSYHIFFLESTENALVFSKILKDLTKNPLLVKIMKS